MFEVDVSQRSTGAGVMDMTAALHSLDADAWESLYRKSYPRLIAYARMRLSVEVADDAVSETMSRALAKIGTYEQGSVGVAGWLTGILRNVIFEYYRSGSKIDLTEDLDDVPAGESPEQILTKLEDRTRVRRAFAALGHTEREVLELRIIAGLDANETGHILGKKPGTVRMAQARAIQSLRAQMNGSNR